MLIEFDNNLYKSAIKKANSEGKNLKGLIIELLQEYTFDDKEEAKEVADKEEINNYGNLEYKRKDTV